MRAGPSLMFMVDMRCSSFSSSSACPSISCDRNWEARSSHPERTTDKKVENYGTLTLMHTAVHALAPNANSYITNKSIKFEVETDELQINVTH